MADLASASPDLAHETVDATTPDPSTLAPESGDDNLLGELARAMHAAATSQYQRLNTDLERRRADQVAAITDRASAETETLKADSETDIGSIDAWAKVETEKIKLERLRRIDARRERLAGQLEREETIKEREIFAIEVAIDAHRNEMELFFGRLERETDPSAIARIASTMPAFPLLNDVAEQARRSAAAEFATIEGQETPASTPQATATEGTVSNAQVSHAQARCHRHRYDGDHVRQHRGGDRRSGGSGDDHERRGQRSRRSLVRTRGTRGGRKRRPSRSRTGGPGQRIACALSWIPTRRTARQNRRSRGHRHMRSASRLGPVLRKKSPSR